MIGILLFALTFGILIYAAALFNANYWKRRGIDGPSSRPFVGNMSEWWGGSIVFKLREWTKRYGKVYGIQEGWKNILVVSDTEMLQEMFTKKFEYFHGRKVNPLQGNIDTEPRVNAFSARGQRWKRLRAVANPVFSVNNLKKVMPIIEDSVRVMMDFLDKQNGSSFNIHPYFHELTMDVISRVAMGQNGTRQFRNENVILAKKIFSQIGSGTFSYVSYIFPFFAPLIRRFVLATGKIRGEPFRAFFDLISEEIRQRKRKKEEGICRESDNVDFIDLFLEAEGDVSNEEQHGVFNKAQAKVSKKMTFDEIVAQCFVFLLAGFDTTANALAITCFYLACNPQAQERLQNEIDDICVEGDPTYEQINRLKYGEAAMNEALRLQPIGAFACARTCSKTTTLGPYEIEAGTVVQADILSVHYDENIWGENVGEFRPERWLEDSEGISSSWFPFGGGPRTCIGLRLAYLEEKLALVHILRKYKIVRTEKTEPKLQMVGASVMNPKSVTVKLELRKPKSI